MCFNNSQSKKARELAVRYGRKSDILEIACEIIEEQQRNGIPEDIALEEYRAAAFPVKITTKSGTYYSYKKYPIITADTYIQPMEWGLIPFWIRSATEADKLRRQTVNARAETLYEKRSYKAPIKYRRCLIPSTGYFEYYYTTPKSPAQPYFIFLKTLEIFSMAGIYDTWIDPATGNETLTFSQITTPGNPKTNLIHNGVKNPFRMPLILKPEQEELWLDDSLTEKEIKQFLVTFPEYEMDAYPVNREFFNNADIHCKEIIERDLSITNILEVHLLF